MSHNELRALVSLMRELGITEYEFNDAEKSTHGKVILGLPPMEGAVLGLAEAGSPPPEESAEEALPKAYRRLPLAYQDARLYGGKLPKLDG